MSASTKPFVIIIQEFEHKVPNFGTMIVGSVSKSEDGKHHQAIVYGKKIGDFKRRYDAIAAAHRHWETEHSGKAISERFQDLTRGGKSCRLLHATGDSIVAQIGHGVHAFVTSFNMDGRCKMSDSEDLDLVALTP